MVKYAYLSKLSTSEFASLKENLKLEVVIPYLDVPVGTDYGKMKEQLRQMESLTQIHLEEIHNKTLQDIQWSEIGLDAYKACLRGKQTEGVYIDHLKGTNPFSEEIVLNVTWTKTRPRKTFATISNVICKGVKESGCAGIKKNDTINLGVSLPLTVRRDGTQALSVIVYVEGIPGEFHLPAIPKKPKKRFVSWQQQVHANVRHRDQQIPAINTFCYPANPSFTLNKNEQIAIGTSYGLKIGGQGGPLGYANPPVLREEGPNNVCWHFDVVSQDANNGYGGIYSLDVVLVSPDP